MCLNPFGTGQCLSTSSKLQALDSLLVSIPLEQGNVFRLVLSGYLVNLKECLNPFGTGQCLST